MMDHHGFWSWLQRTARRALRSWPLIALLGLTALCLSPAIGTGYWAEDIYYSAMIPAGPILHGSSWLGDTLDAIKHSMLVGRFYPITPIITASVFALFQDVAAYKTYIIAVTLLDVILFVQWIRRLTGRDEFALFAAATTVVLFQFRLSVDPILAYYGQIQWVIAAFFVSMILLHRFLECRRVVDGILSVLAFLACNLAYEMTYTLILLPLLLIIQSRPGWHQGWVVARPYLASVGFCAGMTVLMRWLHPTDNYVHKTEFVPGMIVQSLANQLSAGLPLSYYLGDPLSLFSQQIDLKRWIDWVLQPGVIVVFFASIFLNLRILRALRAGSHSPSGAISESTLAGLGVLLATMPAILTAISPYHRAYLSFGVGWIGVMVQYYGVGLLLAIGLMRFVKSRVAGGAFARWKCWATSAIIAGVLAVTFRVNAEVATALNAPPGSNRYRQFVADHGASWHLHRMNLVAALDSGLMNHVPNGSRVQLANLYPYWHDNLYGQFFYTKQTGKLIETFPSQTPSKLLPNTPMFRVRDAVRNQKAGLVVLTPAPTSFLDVFALSNRSEGGRIFVKHPSLKPDPPAEPTILLVGQSPSAPGYQGQPRKRILRLGVELPAINLGRGWGLFAFDDRKQAVDPDSLRLVDDPVQIAGWLRFPEQARIGLKPNVVASPVR